MEMAVAKLAKWFNQGFVAQISWLAVRFLAVPVLLWPILKRFKTVENLLDPF
jgi:hypothetical protein